MRLQALVSSARPVAAVALRTARTAAGLMTLFFMWSCEKGLVRPENLVKALRHRRRMRTCFGRAAVDPLHAMAGAGNARLRHLPVHHIAGVKNVVSRVGHGYEIEQERIVGREQHR